MKLIKTAAFAALSARINYNWKETLDQAINHVLQGQNEPWMASLSDYDRQEHQSPQHKEEMIRGAVEDWLLHQGPELRTMEGDLHPDMKGQVQSYVMSKYGVDPFPGAVEETPIPDADELEQQWS